MPTVSFDGQSFIVDGQRVWLVSGSIHYFRTPHQLWRKRLAAARQAGLNCITTYVAWNVHEPEPGRFNFDGDADLRRFVQMIEDEGMYCILRPGPYICAEWDFGGLPPWLLRDEQVRLRQADGQFLEACSRYLGAVLDQVADLQVTSPGKGTKGGGPILIIQAENEWFCHNPEQVDKYLREIVRYLRENGTTVPISMCNNLWACVDGTIATWNANRHLAADLRQLQIVQPDAPRIVAEYWPGWFDRWGGEHHREFDAELNSCRLAQILASGAQYNLYMFHGGTNFGFYGGRSVATADCFMTTSYDYDAPLREAGGRGDKYRAVKRISTFASQFGHVFAHLDPGGAQAAAAPNELDEHALSVIQQRGGQGDVAFLFRSRGDTIRHVDVLLPDGLTLPVPIGSDCVAWFVTNTQLGGVATLTYTNLRPWAFLDKRMLVLFGPAGADGLVCINGSPLSVTVPSGRTPAVEQHEELTVVVLNGEQVDAAYLRGSAVAIGAAELDDDNAPVPLSDWRQMTTIEADGTVRRSRPAPTKRRAAPRLNDWQHAAVTEMIDGRSATFEAIDGPMSHEALGCDFGYGWYRLSLRESIDGLLLAPGSADRLHLFDGGRAVGVLGRGPGAVYEPAHRQLSQELVVLTDNMGRSNFNWNMADRKGLFDHLYTVERVELPEPEVTPGEAPDLFELGGFFGGMRRGDRPPADSVTWTVEGMRSGVMVIDIEDFTGAAMLLVNDQPVAAYHPEMARGAGRFTLEAGKEFGRGTTRLTLALFEKFDPARRKLDNIKLYRSTAKVTSRAKWSFAPWTPPADESLGPMPQGSSSLPCWYRARFRVRHTDQPLWLQIPLSDSLTKGQLHLNGHNVGRYFAATAEGQPVGPQTRYYLPEPWLRTDGPNELMIFEEHGRSPKRCKLVYDPMGPYGE